jgi:hypothetical protein
MQQDGRRTQRAAARRQLNPVWEQIVYHAPVRLICDDLAGQI